MSLGSLYRGLNCCMKRVQQLHFMKKMVQSILHAPVKPSPWQHG
jgi:hypothetical protein